MFDYPLKCLPTPVSGIQQQPCHRRPSTPHLKTPTARAGTARRSRQRSPGNSGDWANSAHSMSHPESDWAEFTPDENDAGTRAESLNTRSRYYRTETMVKNTRDRSFRRDRGSVERVQVVVIR